MKVQSFPAKVSNPLSMAAMVKEGNGRVGTIKSCSLSLSYCREKKESNGRLEERHYILSFRYLLSPLVISEFRDIRFLTVPFSRDVWIQST